MNLPEKRWFGTWLNANGIDFNYRFRDINRLPRLKTMAYVAVHMKGHFLRWAIHNHKYKTKRGTFMLK